ncbi:hypothetical protein H0H87_011665 [Tephrocybe sp. NHM501043]|nr:hypothetical protein H0H87_011665 [Tephrocybe sp. NHM501043]
MQAINIMMGLKLDAQIKVLQSCIGAKHWANSVSKLKQVTGCKYRELKEVFITVINGDIDSCVMYTLDALINFIFQVQNLVFFKETMVALSAALQEFHDNKQAIIAAGGRYGKKGNIDHF